MKMVKSPSGLTFHALAKGEGIFALSQAIEELLEGKTFFLTVTANATSQDLAHVRLDPS